MLDGLIMRADPGSHGLALVPRGVIPDQSESCHALCSEALATPGQKVGGDGADGAPIDEPQPQLAGLERAMTHQQAITGQGFRVGIVLGTLQFLQLGHTMRLRPAMLVGLGESAPPDLVGIAKRPGGVPAG
jgi:hypothetical protein